MRPLPFTTIGSAYEKYCAILLRKYRFELQVVGSSGDRGIDLLGRWCIPDHSIVSIAAQCKYISKKLASSVCREFEGSFLSSHMHSWHSAVRMGIIFCNQTMSDQCREQFMNSQVPCMFVKTVNNNDLQLQNEFVNRIPDELDDYPEAILMNNSAKDAFPLICINLMRSHNKKPYPVMFYKAESIFK